MEPVFMYWNKVKFEGDDNYKLFNVNFNDGDNLTGVLFKKEKKYFITSLSLNIEIEKDLKKLSDYKKIKEISEKLNEVVNKGSEHLHEDTILEINDVNELLPDKTKRKLSTKSLEFFDEKTKKKKKVLIYSQYKELRLFGLKFKKENGIIDKFNINLVEDEKIIYFYRKSYFTIKINLLK